MSGLLIIVKRDECRLGPPDSNGAALALRIFAGDYINATTVTLIFISLLLPCLTSGLMGIITPFATDQSPVHCGRGYLPSRHYWRLGAIFGVIFLAVFLAIGVPSVMAIK